MRTIGLVVITGLLMIMGLLNIQKVYNIRENVLYTQEELKINEPNSDTQDGLITRNKAIEKVQSIFREGLGIDLEDEALEMHINLCKDAKFHSVYRWHIDWVDKQLSRKYTCYMDSSSGRILYISIGSHSSKQEQRVSNANLTEAQIRDILEPFLNSMNMNLEDYDLDIKWHLEYKEVYQRYQNYYFKDRENTSEGFIVEIDTIEQRLKEYIFKETE